MDAWQQAEKMAPRIKKRGFDDLVMVNLRSGQQIPEVVFPIQNALDEILKHDIFVTAVPIQDPIESIRLRFHKGRELVR